jgi:type I restriction enzyme S subunit
MKLPKTWNLVSLDETVGNTGLITDGDWIISQNMSLNGEIRLIQLADIGIGEFLDRSQKFITAEKFKELNCTELKEEDILISRMADPIGRACLLPQLNQKAITAVDVTILRTDRKIAVPKYIKYLCNTKFFIKIATAAATGTTRSRITRKNLEKIKIPLPTLSEQHRIVEILDQADTLRRMRAEADAKAERILPALFIKMFGDPATNPMGWDVVKMSSLYTISPNYGTMIPPNPTEGNWLDLRVMNIQNEQLSLEDRKYVDLPPEAINRHEVRDGDLLLARAIGSAHLLGKCIVAYPGKEKWAFDSHLMRVRFNRELVYPEFIQSFLTIPSGRQEFLRMTRQSAIQFNINTKEFGSILIPLPPPKLQKEFIDKLSNIKELKSKQTNSGNLVNNLFEILLQRAFSGELTAKWREAHIKELLAEMEEQAKILNLRDNGDYQQLSML